MIQEESSHQIIGRNDRVSKILVFAPHNDDEVLGVGGTIAKYANTGHHVTVCEVTSGGDKRLVQQIKNEALQAHKLLGVEETLFMELPVVALKEVPTIEINRKFCEVVQLTNPEVVFLPHIGDIHIDHQEVAKAAMVAIRPLEAPQIKAVYAYETLSETEWNIPNAVNGFYPMVWSDITNYMDIKLNAMCLYKTQLREFPHPRSLEAIKALGSLRGSTIGKQYAESFICIRSLI